MCYDKRNSLADLRFGAYAGEEMAHPEPRSCEIDAIARYDSGARSGTAGNNAEDLRIIIGRNADRAVRFPEGRGCGVNADKREECKRCYDGVT